MSEIEGEGKECNYGSKCGNGTTPL